MYDEDCGFLDILNLHLWTILLNINKAYVEICKYI